jgi:hypothetical protein
MRFNELEEKAPPGMEQWIKDRKADFKERYGKDWQRVLYATAWKQKNNESVEEASQRVDSLVTDALKIMQGSSMNDAIQALKTVLGDREFSGRRGHYNFYVRQLMDMYGQRGVAEAGRRYTSYHDELSSRERDEQNAMDQYKRDFKRQEMQHELGHEDDPNFERNMRQQQIDRDRGPWYIRIDGVIYKQKGVAKSFDWKRGANNYALAMIKNNPSLQGKIMLSKSAEDKAKESVTESAEQLEERRKAKKKHKVTVRNPDTGRNIKVDFGEPEDITKHKKHKKH